MAAYSQDSFGSTAGTALTHVDYDPTPIGGGSSTDGPWEGNGSVAVSASGRARNTTGAAGVSVRRPSGESPPTYDVDLSFDFVIYTMHGSGLSTAAILHAQSNSNDQGRRGYHIQISNNVLSLRKIWAGTAVTMDSVSGATWNTGGGSTAVYRVRAESRVLDTDDLAIAVYVQRSDDEYLKPDGTYQSTEIACMEASDTTDVQAVNPVGMVWFSTANGDTSGIHIDNIVYNEVDAPPAPADAFSLEAPGDAAGSPGVASDNFTVTPNGEYTGTITPSDSAAGGTFTPSSITWTAESDARTFTYTPVVGSLGADVEITAAGSPSLTPPAAVDYMVRTGRVVLDGNSLFVFSTMDARLLAELGANWLVETYAQSGHDTPTVATRYGATVAARANAKLSRNIYIAWEITNHLSLGANAATAITAIEGLYQAATDDATWSQVVAVTCIPRQQADPFEADRLTVNQALRDNWTGYATNLVDLTTDAAFDASPTAADDYDNATYYSGDSIHLATAGYDIVEAALLSAISAGPTAPTAALRRKAHHHAAARAR